jgi:glycosyltransferase involved in cell wall biosynthesis
MNMTQPDKSIVRAVSPALSVIVPAHNEEKYIGPCLSSIRLAAERAKVLVDIVVVLNRCTDSTREIAEAYHATCIVEDRRSIAAVRNAGIRSARADSIVTIDADSIMSPGALEDVLAHLDGSRYIGGGTRIYPERWSVGIVFSLIAVMPYVIAGGVSVGMLWFRRESFDTLGGFDERLVSVEDIDFAQRLKKLGAARGLKYGTLRGNWITTSCRKFDALGDWYLFKSPVVVYRIFNGRNTEAANRFYYDFER